LDFTSCSGAPKVNGPASVHVDRHERHRRIRQRDITPPRFARSAFTASKPEAHFVLLPPGGVTAVLAAAAVGLIGALIGAGAVARRRR
jgi:hypothetical protein